MNGFDAEDVRLRAAEPEDLDAVYQVENDTSIWWVGSQSQPYSRFMLREYLSKSTGDIYTDRQIRLMIERLSDNQIVGMIDLFEFNPRHRRAEVGIVILKKYRHCGFGGKALAALCDYARQHLSIHQLYAYVPTCNTGSVALFQSHGFNIQHLLKEWILLPEGFCDVWLMQKIG